MFGSKCYILNDREQFRKFNAQEDEGLFLRYSMNSHAYCVFNKRAGVMMESVNIALEDVEQKRDAQRTHLLSMIMAYPA